MNEDEQKRLIQSILEQTESLDISGAATVIFELARRAFTASKPASGMVPFLSMQNKEMIVIAASGSVADLVRKCAALIENEAKQDPDCNVIFDGIGRNT